MAKSKTVKFEVGQLVEFNNRVGRVSRIAKNGAIYVSVLGEIQGAEQAIEELRVKKADLRLIEESEEIGLSESIPPTAAFSLDSAGGPQSLADATYALRELTFSVTRHSILTAFIDVALNKNIPGYHHQVASNLKTLMAAASDPVHDSVGYARINTWTMEALKLVVKNKDRVAKMLSQPIEAAPIKIDRVTKLGMWIDYRMNREGPQVNDMTAAYDSCYVYDAIGKKLEACTFVVVEVIQSGDQGEAGVIPFPMVGKESTPYQEYMTAQAAIAARKQYMECYRPTEPDLHLYCGIVPILKTGLSMQAAIEDTLASVIGSLK